MDISGNEGPISENEGRSKSISGNECLAGPISGNSSPDFVKQPWQRSVVGPLGSEEDSELARRLEVYWELCSVDPVRASLLASLIPSEPRSEDPRPTHRPRQLG